MPVLPACAALAAVVMLSGCAADEPGAVSLPPTSPVPSAAASATPTPVAVPTAAQAATPEGAVEFARLYFRVLNDAAVKGKSADLRQLAQEACKACDGFASSIDQLYGSGGRLEGGSFTLRAAEAPALSAEATTARVTVVYDVAPTRQLAADGSVIRALGALQGVAAEVQLSRNASGWRVVEING